MGMKNPRCSQGVGQGDPAEKARSGEDVSKKQIDRRVARGPGALDGGREAEKEAGRVRKRVRSREGPRVHREVNGSWARTEDRTRWKALFPLGCPLVGTFS